MSRFDTVIVADWSARSAPSPAAPSPDSIWIAVADGDSETEHYFRTRAEAMDFITAKIDTRRSAGQRVLAGFDFPFGYPVGFGVRLTGQGDPLALWDWLANRIADGGDNRNNRFEVAAGINALFPGVGPFWGRPTLIDAPGLPERGSERRGHGLPERRRAETRVPKAQTVWKLYTTGSVGSQALLGIPWLTRLRHRLGAECAVWPFETPDRPVVLAEVYPSLIAAEVAAACSADPEAIRDAVQVRLLARALLRLSRDDRLAPLFDSTEPAARSEGWILGIGHEGALSAAARPDIVPPRFDNDCFALPPGVDWIPVDDALNLLKVRMAPVTGTETLALEQTDGRILARDHIAARSHPPRPNSAVDGYGFAGVSVSEGPQVLPLIDGRAAAGEPFEGKLPAGHALRILTGAVLPRGVDTVVLEEDTTVAEGHVAFEGPVKAGANTRAAGEDVKAGEVALAAGRRLGPQDLALLAALGLSEVEVRQTLRVAVLSTGDELVEPGGDAGEDRIFDANRPMLLSLADRWGHRPVDMGIAPDTRASVRAALDRAAAQADVILTSGGASAGDEDHVSAILREEGQVTAWRIALKPGRPLLLGLWKNRPVFGMPGNPVAAFVCALIFARPALSVLAGGRWDTPAGFDVPAAFSKRKKPGRREYLRARLTPNGEAEVFQSEGSGRISGLSWADGLVEIGDGAREIAPGDPVRYLPFGSFGL